MGGGAHKEGRERETERERERITYFTRERRDRTVLSKSTAADFILPMNLDRSPRVWQHMESTTPYLMSQWQCKSGETGILICPEEHTRETGVLICPEEHKGGGGGGAGILILIYPEEHTGETGILICPEEHARSTGIPICPEAHTGGTGILICPAEHTGGTGILICSEEHSRGTGILTSLWATGEFSLLFEPLENFQLLTILLLKRNMPLWPVSIIYNIYKPFLKSNLQNSSMHKLISNKISIHKLHTQVHNTEGDEVIEPTLSLSI